MTIIPSSPSTENFIGIVGSNLIFEKPSLNENPPEVLSSRELIAKLGLNLGDPRLDEVKATFSRLTQVIEIRAFGDPNFPFPEPGKPLNAPADVLETCREGLIEMTRNNRKINVKYDDFAHEFAKHLEAQHMPELAAKLI